MNTVKPTGVISVIIFAALITARTIYAQTLQREWRALQQHPLIAELAPLMDEGNSDGTVTPEQFELLRDTLVNMLKQTTKGPAALQQFNTDHRTTIESINPVRDNHLLISLAQTVADRNLQIMWAELYSEISMVSATKPPVRTSSAEIIRNWMAEHQEDLARIKVAHLSDEEESIHLTCLPPEIAYFTNLEELYLDDNHLLALPESLAKLRALTTLTLSNNNFIIVPDVIMQLTQLKELVLRKNHLDTLPENIASLQDLELLDVSQNSIDTLPDEIGALRSLKILNISNNQIATLPEAMKHLTHLEDLYLDHNRIRDDSLKVILEALDELQSVAAAGNLLEHIPTSPKNPALVIDLSDNPISDDEHLSQSSNGSPRTILSARDLSTISPQNSPNRTARSWSADESHAPLRVSVSRALQFDQ